VTVDDLMVQRTALGAHYADLVRQLVDTRVELAALDHVTSSPIAGNRHGDAGFVGDMNEMPRMLSHSKFSPYISRRLSTEINERVAELAESLRTVAA
jgi:hypothetical protein